MTKLTAVNVRDIIEKCVSEHGDLEVQVVINTFVFDSAKIEEHKDDIIEMLDGLPPQFKRSCGGGWSFINACDDKDGVQWGEHSNIEQLLALGIAIGKVNFGFPREMWNILPAGMPYFTVDM